MTDRNRNDWVNVSHSNYRIDLSVLEKVLLDLLEPVELDVLDIVASVAFADRSVLRTGAGWSRRLRVRIGVRNPKLWKSPVVATKLTECLELLTGDSWCIEFAHKSVSSSNGQQGYLGLLNSEYSAVIPFSGGLDSWAHAKLYLGKEKLPPILMQLKNAGVNPRVVESLGSRSDSVCRSQFILRGLPNRKESTYRTRSFVYLTSAAIVAAKSNAATVAVTENGQGSLATVLVPFGRAWPLMGANPRFTALISSWLWGALGIDVYFAHDALWKTKGQVLSETLPFGSHGHELTTSCPRPNAKLPISIGGLDCGVCSNCLLRRVSLFAAGIDDQSRYCWRDLCAPDLDLSLAKSASRRSNQTDLKYAAHAVLDHQRLASHSMNEVSSITIIELARSLGSSVAEVRGNLHRLLEAHQQEWYQFLESLPKDSWIQKIHMKVE